MPAWLTAPVLHLDLPDSPLVRGSAAPVETAAPAEVGAAAELIEVPPLVEPVLSADVEPAPSPVSQPDPGVDIAAEIAAILARAPRPIRPVEIDADTASAAAPPAPAETAASPETAEAAPTAPAPMPTTPDILADPAPASPVPPVLAVEPVLTPASEPTSNGAATPEPSAMASPSPAPAKPSRAPGPRRVAIRRTRPRVARQPHKPASSAPANLARTNLSERLEHVGGARAHRPEAATQPAPAAQPRPAELPAARAPARDRPVMAPAAANIARTPRGAVAPAAVPETRPLTQNRRLYRRVMLGAEFEVDGAACRLIDLSIGGFAAAGRAEACHRRGGAGDPANVDRRDRYRHPLFGPHRLRQRRPRRRPLCRPDRGQTAFLRYIVTWRGEAIGAVGTTTLLDAITRWPSAPSSRTRARCPRPPAEEGWVSRLLGRIPLLGWRRRG